jgi:hypothetical protein
MAVLVTPCYPETAGRKLSQQSAKRNPLKLTGEPGGCCRLQSASEVMI